MADVHPTAIIEAGAELAETATVGAYSIIGHGVRLGDRVRIHSHVVIGGNTLVGQGTEIFPFASIGLPPQDRKYHGEQNRVEIGKNCTIREQVTVNPGTEQGDLATRIGDECILLISSHVAHDCQLGRGVTLVNNVALGGHCHIGDYAVLGGASAVHQYVRIGESGFVGGMSGVDFDIIPFGSAIGNRAYLGGLNIVGLTRRGFSREDIHQLRRAYRMLFAPEGTLKERLADVEEEFAADPNVRKIIDFIRVGGDRPLCTPRRRDEPA